MEIGAILIIIFSSIGIFFAGMLLMTQYSVDLLEWDMSTESKPIFFIHSSNRVRFRSIWSMIAAIVFMVNIIAVMLVV